MWCIVSGSGSPARYTPGGFWSRTAPRISTRSSPSRNARTRYSRSWSTSRPSGSGGRISSLAEHVRTLSIGHRRRIVDPGYGRRRWASRHRRPRCGAATSSWSRSPPSTPTSCWRRRRSTGRATGSPRSPATPTTWTATSPTCSPSAAVGTDMPFAQRRVADGRIVGCTRYLEMRRWRGRPEPDEVEIGGTWLGRRRPAHADQHRGQAAAARPTPSTCGASTGWPSPPTAATSAAARRSSASAPASRAILRHHRPSLVAGRGRTAAGHGAVLDHRRRLAGRRAGPAHPARRPGMTYGHA